MWGFLDCQTDESFCLAIFVLNRSQFNTNPLPKFVLNRSQFNTNRFCLAIFVLNRSRFITNSLPIFVLNCSWFNTNPLEILVLPHSLALVFLKNSFLDFLFFNSANESAYLKVHYDLEILPDVHGIIAKYNSDVCKWHLFFPISLRMSFFS